MKTSWINVNLDNVLMGRLQRFLQEVGSSLKCDGNPNCVRPHA